MASGAAWEEIMKSMRQVRRAPGPNLAIDQATACRRVLSTIVTVCLHNVT